MIIVRQWAGLGNQLFIYAYYRALQEQGKDARLDISYYDTMQAYGGNGSYKIPEIFPNSRNVYASPAECRRLAVYQMDPFHRLLRKAGINKKNYVSQMKSYGDGGWCPQLLELNDGHYIEGYYQSERYFQNIAPILRKELLFKSLPETKFTHLVDSCQSVSIHVRRGDYVAGGRMALSDTAYYRRAIQTALRDLPGAEFFVFSDDIPGCKIYFAQLLEKDPDILQRLFYVDDSPAAWVDLALMSVCHYHIIADSTFSWWGSWLDNRTDSVVYAPSRWIFTGSQAMTDILPDRWRKIEVD